MSVLSSAWWSWASMPLPGKKEMPVRHLLHRHFLIDLADKLHIHVAVLGGEVQLLGRAGILLQSVLAAEKEIAVVGVGDPDPAASGSEVKAVSAAVTYHRAGDAAVLDLGVADIGGDVLQLEGAAVLDGR